MNQSVSRRMSQIHRQCAASNKLHLHATQRQYVSGETHWYPGKRYLLKVKQSTHCQPATRLLQGRLHLTVNNDSPDTVKEQLKT